MQLGNSQCGLFLFSHQTAHVTFNFVGWCFWAFGCLNVPKVAHCSLLLFTVGFLVRRVDGHGFGMIGKLKWKLLH